MDDFVNLTEDVETTLIDAGNRDIECCLSDANDWCCVRALGHEMPHQASSGPVGSHVYAEWEDA